MRKLILVAAAISLSGCMTREEMLAQRGQEQDAACRSMGAQPGTDGYLNCRMQLAQMAAAKEAADAQAGTAMMMAGAAMMSTAPQPVRPVNCSSYRVGATIQTNCY